MLRLFSLSVCRVFTRLEAGIGRDYFTVVGG